MVHVRVFKPLLGFLPEIAPPVEKPALNERLKWTGFALLIFAIMSVVKPLGIATGSQAAFLQNLQLITASSIGTLATLGIGPIVMASIILQLLVGAGFIQFNQQNPEERQIFQGTQKLGAVVFAFVEAIIYTMSGFVPSAPGAFSVFILILQLAFAAIVLIYLDELIGKYGIGSGVGLFIAAGVSFNIIWGAFSWISQEGVFIGQVPLLFQSLLGGDLEGSALLILLSTIAVFLVVVFAESMKIEIPITFGQQRGMSGKYPLKFFYVSNMPVIFAAALLANVQLWGIFLQSAGLPILGTFVQNQPTGGLAYYLSNPFGYLSSPENIVTTLSSMDRLMNIGVYALFMIIFCIIFGKFWVEMQGLGPKQVASQMQGLGWQIPGFRRDPRVIEKVLEKYIPMVTVLGSAAVGLLAVIADLTGALGTGTGILLTVGILYRLYEELASQQAFELMPALRGIL